MFVANNLMTIGALECLVHHGIEVPREIGVVGFDEIPWADLVRPSLSTVAQPTYEMGKTAGQLLTSRRATPGKPRRDRRPAHHAERAGQFHAEGRRPARDHSKPDAIRSGAEGKGT